MDVKQYIHQTVPLRVKSYTEEEKSNVSDNKKRGDAVGSCNNVPFEKEAKVEAHTDKINAESGWRAPSAYLTLSADEP